MEHIHGSYMSENRFQIDPSSREIISESKDEIVITQFDHNSERFIFTLPKVVDEHDMTLCSSIRIHYINTGGSGKTVKDIYEVQDIKVGEDKTTVTFSWLLSQNTTSITGALSFAIQFICTTDDHVEYNWSTLPYKAIKVSETYNNADEIVLGEYSDIISQWKEELFGQFEEISSFLNTAILKSVDLTKCATITSISSKELKPEITSNSFTHNFLNAGEFYTVRIDVTGYVELEFLHGSISDCIIINGVKRSNNWGSDSIHAVIKFKGVVVEPIICEIHSSHEKKASFLKFVTSSEYETNVHVLNIEKKLDMYSDAVTINKVDLTKCTTPIDIPDYVTYKITDNSIEVLDDELAAQRRFKIDVVGFVKIDTHEHPGDGMNSTLIINGKVYSSSGLSYKGLVMEPIIYETTVDRLPIDFITFVTSDDRIRECTNIENGEGIDSLRQAPKTEAWTPGNQKIIDFLNANKEKYSAYFDENGNVVIKEGAFGDWSTALSGYGHAGAQHSVVNNRRVIILPDAIGAHGEGNEILIAAVYGHGEGSFNIIGEKAEKSHIEGYGNVTYAPVSHVGGQYNTVEETASFADVTGVGHNVSGTKAFVRGTSHNVSGDSNTVLGWKHRVSGKYQTVIGKKNDDDPTKAFIVGGGNENQADDVARRNIHTLDWYGNGYFAGDITFTHEGKEYKVSDLLKRIAELEKGS